MANRPNLKAIAEASPGAAMIERLRKGTENERLCQWPGTADDDHEARFLLVPLNCDELQEAYAGAHHRFANELSMPLNVYNLDDFHSEINNQVLARAMRLVDDRSKLMFSSADELRKQITPEERSAITTEWLTLIEQSDPDPDEMSDELFAKLDEYAKKKDVAQLLAMPSSTLALYITGMADRSPS